MLAIALHDFDTNSSTIKYYLVIRWMSFPRNSCKWNRIVVVRPVLPMPYCKWYTRVCVFMYTSQVYNCVLHFCDASYPLFSWMTEQEMQKRFERSFLICNSAVHDRYSFGVSTILWILHVYYNREEVPLLDMKKCKLKSEYLTKRNYPPTKQLVFSCV